MLRSNILNYTNIVNQHDYNQMVEKTLSLNRNDFVDTYNHDVDEVPTKEVGEVVEHAVEGIVQEGVLQLTNGEDDDVNMAPPIGDTDQISQQLCVDEDNQEDTDVAMEDLEESYVQHEVAGRGQHGHEDEEDEEELDEEEEEEIPEEEEEIPEEEELDEELEALSSDEGEPPSPPPSPPRRFGTPEDSLEIPPRETTPTLATSPTRDTTHVVTFPTRVRTLDFQSVPRREQSESTDSERPSHAVTRLDVGTLRDEGIPSNTTHEALASSSMDHDLGVSPSLSTHKLEYQTLPLLHPHHHLQPPFLPPPPPTPSQQHVITIEMLAQMLAKNQQDTIAATIAEISNVQKNFMAELNAVKMAQVVVSQKTSVGPVPIIAPPANVVPSSISSITPLPLNCFIPLVMDFLTLSICWVD